nr:hypothetical protein [Tanacetum cinerariifolium]
MAFTLNVVASRFPSTNNQLRTSSKPRNQATIQDSRGYGSTSSRKTESRFCWYANLGKCFKFRGNNAAGQARVVKCYNCQGEGHMMLMVHAHEAGQELDEEQLTFLADLGIPDVQAIQTAIPHNIAFQTDDLDAYDFDCNDISSAKAILMANLSSHDSDVLSEETKTVNESLTAELKRYKERVKTFEQRFNVDSNSREKLIDSQIDDTIQDRNALKQEIYSLNKLFL